MATFDVHPPLPFGQPHEKRLSDGRLDIAAVWENCARLGIPAPSSLVPLWNLPTPEFMSGKTALYAAPVQTRDADGISLPYQLASGNSTIYYPQNVLIGTGDFSVLLVAKIPSNASVTGALVSNSIGTYQFRIQGNYLANGTSVGAAEAGALTLLTYGGAWTNVGASGICDGQMHSYFGVRSGTNHRLYRDNQLVAEQTGTVRDVDQGKGDWCWGWQAGYKFGNLYEGQAIVAMAAIWNQALPIGFNGLDILRPRQFGVFVDLAAGGGTEITPAIGALAGIGVAGRNDRGVFVPTEVDV